PTLKMLQQGNIRCVMVTGDNLMTALSVSRQCGLIEPGELVALLDVRQTDHQLAWKLEKSPIVSLDHELESTRSADLHIAISGPAFALLRNQYPELLIRQVA